MHVITAATGQIGQKLVQELLSRGEKVRAVARNAGNLKDLARKGAETAVVDLADAGALAQALRGASTVFLLIPPHYAAADFRAYQNKISESFVSALQKSGVKHVVNLSSVGAQLPDKTGPIAGLHDNEERLNKLEGVNVLHLRPAYFMENFFMNIGLIKGQGINGSPMKGDMPIPMVATRDIARAAADHLVKRDFSGKSVRELLGPRDVSLNEATSVLGKAVGKPDLKYVQFPYADAEKAMVGMGLSADVARLFVEMSRGFNEGVIRPVEDRSARSSTPTTIEEFAGTFASAYSR